MIFSGGEFIITTNYNTIFTQHNYIVVYILYFTVFRDNVYIYM